MPVRLHQQPRPRMRQRGGPVRRILLAGLAVIGSGTVLYWLLTRLVIAGVHVHWTATKRRLRTP
jgi:hypothetical protein